MEGGGIPASVWSPVIQGSIPDDSQTLKKILYGF